MSTFGEKFKALLATGRVANLPTVWSNVLVAFGLALSVDKLPYAITGTSYPLFETTAFLSGIIIASFLYVGGCLLGDYKDIAFDQKNRPDRPLPQGIISGRLVIIIAVLLIAAADILAIFAAPLCAIIGFDANIGILQSIPLDTYLQSYEPNQIFLAFTLTFLIVTYACNHKKNRLWALANMASCRTTLIFFAVSLTSTPLFSLAIDPTFHTAYLSPPFLYLAFAVGLYTFLLSSVAATESSPEKFSHRKFLSAGLMTLPLLAIPLISPTDLLNTTLTFILFYAIYLAWMIYSVTILPHSKPSFVSNALAGFCLLDACFASTFSLPTALICLALFGLALLFQKITPAT